MLSRVAERIYWLGRYIERMENTARLVDVYGNVLLDLPRPAKLVWESLLAITGSMDRFSERYSRAEERNVVKFLLADRTNPDSVMSCLLFARENGRTVREIVPARTWEGINDLYHYFSDSVERPIARQGREALLSHIINASQAISGSIDGIMSRDAAYHFLQAGRYLERADMTSRIVDVGVANVFPWISDLDRDGKAGDAHGAYESILWMSVLQSLGALQMYRRLVPERVRADEVVTFLFQDENFPRSITHCLGAARAALSRLPRSKPAVDAAQAALQRVGAADVETVLEKGRLYELVDELQIEFSDVDEAIRQNWFLPVETD
ncbi:MAG: alpha-E domain-containing protein [Gammaproteobacteria bacterium]